MSDNSVKESVDSYISRILPQATKEFKFVKDNDWTEISNVKTREQNYKIQKLLVDRNIKSAVKLYKMAGEDIKSKRVRSTLRTLIEFYKVLNDRYKVMIDTFNWTEFNLEDDKEAGRAAAEVKFQAGVLDDVNALDSELRGINYGDESDTINVAMHSNTPIPFMMKEYIEGKFPEISEFLKKRDKK